MGEDKPNPESRMQALIAPLIVSMVVLALVLAVFFMGRNQPKAPEPASPPPEPVVASPVPAPVKPLSRRDLIESANIAAASAADGVNYAEGVSIVGRQFVMRIPFGCEAGGYMTQDAESGSDKNQLSARYDAKKRALTLLATPSNWNDLQPGKAGDAINPVEHIEGFWVAHPWSFAESCTGAALQADVQLPDPKDAPDSKEGSDAPVELLKTDVERTLGLARMFRTDGSRVNRRDGRPYKFVINLPKDDESALRQSYRLALEGRIDAFDDGAPMHCDVQSGARPVCYYAVRVDRVAFENQRGEMLAEWRE